MSSTITPFLMFTGQAEEAMRLYTSVFPDSEVEEIQYHKAGDSGVEGTVKRGSFRLNNQRFICFDSPPVHDFTFTPSISMFVDFGSADEVDTAFHRLSEGGSVFMPLGTYPFSERFGWINDRFGVSWQLSLPRGQGDAR